MGALKGCIFRCITPFLILLGLSLLVTPAWAGDSLFLSGAEGGNGNESLNYYAFAAVIAPLPKNDLGNGFVQKYWVDFLGYDYISENKVINATAIGLEGALGYQISGSSGWASVYAGTRYSNTRLSPDNPESKVRGNQLRAKFQIEGERNFATDIKFNAIASYIIKSDSYFTRVRGLYRLYNEVYTGPECIVQGDPDYRMWQYGWVFTSFEPWTKWTIGLKAGIKHIEKAQTSGYLGLELTNVF
jgi:hypothetical protein